MKRIFSMLMALVLVFSLIPGTDAHAAEEVTQLCKSVLDANDFVRSMLLQQVEEFTVQLPVGLYYESAYEDIFAHAVAPTQNHKEGDTLLYQSVLVDGYVDIRSGYAYLSYAFAYLTTTQEEAELDAALDALIDELGCNPKKKYDTVKTVYDWLCANISYVADSEDLYDYTAYGAMMNCRATSQGFALLAYQLLLKIGIQCRVISGTMDGVYHAWNAVAVDDWYYNVDAALDAGKSEYTYFLKSDASMAGHVRDAETIALYWPFCLLDYQDPSEICNQIGHRWWEIDCQIPVVCQTCGLENGEYGPHNFEGADCETARLCCICGFQDEPREHVYFDDFYQYCSQCNHKRSLTCVGVPYKLIVEGSEESDPPQLELADGLTAKLMEAYPLGYDYYWIYEVVFAQADRYKVTAKFENREPQVYDILVYEAHQFDMMGTCMVCEYKDPDFHYHEFDHATCQKPMTCIVCGLTQGEPADHYFYTTDCVRIPGVCTTCGLAQEKPMGHVYSYYNNWQCDMCGQWRVFTCNEGAAEHWFNDDTGDGYEFLEADPGLTVTSGEYMHYDNVYSWQFLFAAEEVGQYEARFLKISTGETVGVTVKIEQHEFLEGRCGYCMQTDPNVHFHEWIYATCTEPQTCATCGLVEGYPTGHSYPNTPCSEDRVCIYCDEAVEAPSHMYSDDLDTDCNFCGQYRATFCEGTGTAIIISGLGEGDFYLVDPPEGVSLVLTEYFVSESIHYWEYVIYSDYAGLYELTLRQKNNEEPMGVTLKVLAHEFDQGVCLNCGTQEGADHIHRWKSATCTEPMTCSVCGETNGEPLNHDYGTYRCAEYAKCGRCGHSRGPVKHTYDDRFDQFCNVCDQQHTTICFGQDLTVAYVNHDQNGFWLENTPDGVKVTLQHTYPYGLNLGYEHVYLLSFSKKGSFELKFVDAEGTEPIYLTVDVVSHSYKNGICDGCGKLDESQHVHDWIPANCDFAKTCNICGKQEGSPLGHDFRNGVCTRCEWVNNGIMGDATGDGNINYKDAMMVLRASVGLETLTQEQKAFGDVDGNEKLDYKDAMMILRFSVGLITQWN